MNLLAKTALLLNGLLLALPPGVCCWSFSATQHVTTPVVEDAPTSCCAAHESKTVVPACAHTGTEHPQPTAPATCCCRRDVVVQKSSQDDGDFATLLGWVAALPDVALPTPDGLIAQAGCEHLLDPGPPLRVLQCVWRC